MKKIAIVTINDNSNFGNRLQNYALEKYLIDFDLQVNTIWKFTIEECIKLILKKFIYIFFFKIKES